MYSLPNLAMESKQYCDNTKSCHEPVIIAEDNSAIFVGCKECFVQERIGKDVKGNPEHRAYGDFFKRELLQPDHPLYYKYAGAGSIRVV